MPWGTHWVRVGKRRCDIAPQFARLSGVAPVLMIRETCLHQPLWKSPSKKLNFDQIRGKKVKKKKKRCSHFSPSRHRVTHRHLSEITAWKKTGRADPEKIAAEWQIGQANSCLLPFDGIYKRERQRASSISSPGSEGWPACPSIRAEVSSAPGRLV